MEAFFFMMNIYSYMVLHRRNASYIRRKKREHDDDQLQRIIIFLSFYDIGISSLCLLVGQKIVNFIWYDFIRIKNNHFTIGYFFNKRYNK